MKKYSVVGKRLPRVDGPAKATGEAKFSIDVMLTGMLFGKILRSPLPHAKICHLDTSRAQRLPGVRGVITGKDLGVLKRGDEYPLALDKVRYIGNEIAAVAAIDEDTAEEALGLIRVDYEPIPAVFDMEEATRDGAPKIHDEAEKNIAFILPMSFGDPEQAFKEARHIFEDQFSTGPSHNCYLELNSCLANYDSTGKLNIWTSTQSPYFLRKDLAESLRLTPGNVRVVSSYIGGGFDDRLEMMTYHLCSAFLSKKTGRPVKIQLSREEMLILNKTGSFPMRVHVKTGLKEDGTILVQQAKITADGGAYMANQVLTLWIIGAISHLPYFIPNSLYEGKLVYTNNSPYGINRGAGLLQVRSAVEQQLVRIEEELAIDIRLKNALRSNSVTANGFKIESCGFVQCLEETKKRTNWTEKIRTLPKYHGIGMGSGGCCSGAKGRIPQDPSSAFVKVHEDGTVTLLTGVTELGQGSNTALSQIVAEELGIELKDVRVFSGDTEITPMDLGTYGQRGTLVGGNAVRAAARDARKCLLEVTAFHLEATPEDLELKDKRIYIKGSPEKGIPISEAALLSLNSEKGEPVMGKGYYNPPTGPLNPQSFYGNIAMAYSFGACVTELRVDEETGKIEVEKMTAAHDCGFAINPMAVEGQVEGQMICGVGQTVFEERLLEQGQTLNPNLLDYKVCTAMDVPMVETIIVEDTDPYGPFGAKECGSGPSQTTSPAIINALYKALGVRVKEFPVTPEIVLELSETE